MSIHFLAETLALPDVVISLAVALLGIGVVIIAVCLAGLWDEWRNR